MEEPLVNAYTPRSHDPIEADASAVEPGVAANREMEPEQSLESFSSSSSTADAIAPRDDQIQMLQTEKRQRVDSFSTSRSASPKALKRENKEEVTECPTKSESKNSQGEQDAESDSRADTCSADATKSPPLSRNRGGFDQPNTSEAVCTKTEEYANQVVNQELIKQEALSSDVAVKKETDGDSKSETKKKRKSKWDLAVPSGDGDAASAELTDAPLPRMGFSDAPTLSLGPGGPMPTTEGNNLATALSSAIANAQQKHGIIGTEARRASRLQVGNLPSGINESEIVMFFNAALVSIGGSQLPATDASKLPVLCSEMFNVGNKTCLLQFRTQADAQTCLTLNGIAYNGCPLKITSIPDYMEIDGAFEEDHRIFLQNLALDMTESQVKALLEQFGTIKSCTMAKDSSGLSKGIGIVEFEDPAVTDVAIQALNGFTVGNRVLLVRRASSVGMNLLAPGSVPVQRSTFVSQLPTSMSHRVFSNFIVAQQVRKARKFGDIHSPVVQLLNCVFREDLLNEKNYKEILEDIRSEASKFGNLEQIVIPCPPKDLSHVPGVGKVFLHYKDVTAARKAQFELNGRKFERRTICAAFYPEDRFLGGTYTFLSARAGQ